VGPRRQWDFLRTRHYNRWLRFPERIEMSFAHKLVTSAVLGAVIVGLTLPALVRGKDEAPATATAPATSARSARAIMADLDQTSAALREVLPSLKSVGDAQFRKDNAEKVLPPLKKMITLLDEMATTQKEPTAAEARLRFLAIGHALGDPESAGTLKQIAQGKDAEVALAAESGLAMGAWVQNSSNAKGQEKVLADYTEIAKAHPSDEGVAETLMIMSQLGAANADMSRQATEVIRTTLKGAAAKQIVAQMDADKAQQDMVGKPLTVAGRTTTGGQFTSADWKGKVVLVDFWATWCGPCRAELPRTKELYKKYHEKGMEMVGVDCDDADDAVNTFTKENDMAWPQLREKDQEEWHPLTKQWGVNGIPTMFLIDKKGVLRYVDAREGTEEKVKKLLAEPDEPGTTRPATAPAK
jgi:thiol-disulfide isomerase/thioredoxin